MRLIICAAALSALTALPAVAKDASTTTQTTEPARAVYVCDSSAMTRRAFTREHGATEFVTAEQAAAAKGQTWSKPKCIKPAEARKLKDMARR